jgi:pimeloyl-ACP methyl ester carboxylesterase
MQMAAWEEVEEQGSPSSSQGARLPLPWLVLGSIDDLLIIWNLFAGLYDFIWLQSNESIGYAVECGVTMRGTGERLARAGYAVYGLDYEGHGRSDGLQGYVPDFQALVQDCDDYFASVVRSHADVRHKSRRFLVGESMGGAVALLLHRARPDFWTGAVLVAPMCKIADDMRPHPVVVNILRAMTSIIPTWKVVPTADVIDAAYRMQEKRDEIRGNPYCYKDKPRLKTAFELLKVSLDVEENLLHKVIVIIKWCPITGGVSDRPAQLRKLTHPPQRYEHFRLKKEHFNLYYMLI